MTHARFLEELNSVGIKLSSESITDCGSTTFQLKLNDLDLSVKDYEVFGYRCGGVYASCIRTSQENFNSEDFNVAVKTAIDVLQSRLEILEAAPTTWHIMEFLKNKNYKTKKEKEAVKVVLGILADNYSNL